MKPSTVAARFTAPAALVLLAAAAASAWRQQHKQKKPPPSSAASTRVGTKREPYVAYNDLNRCYSCMSKIGEELWDSRLGSMKRNFYKPANFTDDCDDPFVKRYMPSRKCRTICLTIQWNLVIMGTQGSRLYLRGCATNIAKEGLRNGTLQYFDAQDICRVVNASQLIVGVTFEQQLQVCSCYGDRCNGANSAATPGRQRLLAPAALFSLLSLLHSSPRLL